MSHEMSEEQLHDLIKQIKHDEKTLRFSTSFTPEDAFQLGIQIRTLFHTVLDRVPHLDGEEEHTKEFGHAIYEGFPPTSSAGIVIHIETFTGHRLFTATAGEASSLKPDNWIWVEGKKNIVRRFHRSSYGIGRDCVAKGKSPEEAGYRLPEYSAHGGGFPIWIKGVTVAPVAVVIVSGLPQSMDHQLIVDALRTYLSQCEQHGVTSDTGV